MISSLFFGLVFYFSFFGLFSGFIENKILEYNLNPVLEKKVARFFKKRKGSFNS